MDIGALSVSMSAVNFSTNVQVALLDKVLDTAEVTGEMLTEMMDAVAVPGLGEHVDIRA